MCQKSSLCLREIRIIGSFFVLNLEKYPDKLLKTKKNLFADVRFLFPFRRVHQLISNLCNACRTEADRFEQSCCFCSAKYKSLERGRTRTNLYELLSCGQAALPPPSPASSPPVLSRPLPSYLPLLPHLCLQFRCGRIVHTRILGNWIYVVMTYQLQVHIV